MNRDEFEELAAGAALHALSPDDAARYRAAVDEHPEWRSEADADVRTAALLGEAVEPLAPPIELRASLLSQIANTPQEVQGQSDHDQPNLPHSATSARPPRKWARAIFALAACVALVVGVGIGAVALNQYLNRPASVVALQEIQNSADAQTVTVALDGGGSATAHWSPSLGSAVLEADGFVGLADDKTYELWFVRGDEPVSAGTFDTADGRAIAELTGTMHEGDVIAVTVEDAGGSDTGIPTTDPIVVIPTA